MRPPEEILKRFVCVTTESIPGHQILQLIGPVQGSIVRQVHSGDLSMHDREAARIQAADDRKEAISAMILETLQKGGNAIIGQVFDASVLSLHLMSNYCQIKVRQYSSNLSSTCRSERLRYRCCHQQANGSDRGQCREAAEKQQSECVTPHHAVS